MTRLYALIAVFTVISFTVSADAAERQRSAAAKAPAKAAKKERKPKSLAQALAGDWTGTAELKGRKAKDKTTKVAFQLSFDKKMKVQSGSTLAQFKIVDAKVQKYTASKREMQMLCHYALGKRKCSVQLTGQFNADFTELTGTIKTKWIGSGKFTLVLK